jgi:hypothetical protein
MVFAAGRLWAAHRVAWKLFYEADPDGFIDHINGDPGDNRVTNLRDCSHSENLQNQRMHSNNTSGVKGVTKELHHWYRKKPWKASIAVASRRFTLGRYATIEEAEAAVSAARQKLHGKFARSC